MNQVATPPDLADAVARRWKDSSVPLNRPAARSELDAFEARTGVLLPATLRGLYVISNGTLDMDSNGFRFLPIELFDDSGLQHHSGELVTVVDYMVGSWGYAVDMRAGAIARVYRVGIDPQSVEVAASFDGFLTVYLDDYGLLL